MIRRRFMSGGVEELPYLTIEALEDGLTASLSTNACQYSTDGVTWTDLSAGTTTPAINTGEKLYFKATGLTPTEDDGIGTFTVSKKFNLSGNCNSMLFGDNAAANLDLTGYDYAFYMLFYNSTTLQSISRTFLPAMTLANNCYNEMFSRCSSLTTAPELPATTLAEKCYQYMFYGCNSLTEAPELPATTLTELCYDEMFYGCTALTTAPALPAMTLADYCYYRMFNGCTALITAPELPATTLASHCYHYMFQGCTSLTTAPELPATTLAEGCYNSMFADCTALTAAPELPATTLAIYCYYYMFRDCTALTTAPKLPATTLAEGCYRSMFYNCTALTMAPSELPATTLAINCYCNMFTGCTKLNYIKMLATDISASDCLTGWVNGVSSTGTFVKNAAATWDVTGVNGIPEGWTVETASA